MLNERKGDLLANKTNDMAHTKWLCKYHIVFTPKYRRKVIYNQYRKDLRDIIKTLCGYKGVEIIEAEACKDHIHMLVSIPPKYSVSQIMGYLKGKSSLMIYEKYANMKYKYGNSVCISSQAGCRMGCRFCASTIGGLARNLLPSEMLDQIYRIQASIGERVSNVVVMGSGEPLDNYDNLLRFIHILTEEGGLHLSQRNLTVSTCGLVPKMYELAEEKLQMTLAVSLHAPNDEKRQELMPIAKKYSMDELLEACRNYFDKTGRRITFEYSLVAGVNDSEENARELAGRLKGLNCHVNLIPVNPVRERSFVRSTRQAVENFKINLEKCGINGTIRREMGSDIDGACGQLRKRYMEKTESEK